MIFCRCQVCFFFFFFQAEDGIRDVAVTGVQTCALPISKPIGLEAQIEEVEALQCVEEIAKSSPRLEALIFGPYDYAASQGVDPRAIEEDSSLYEGDIWHYARNKIVIAARAAGIDAIDGP